MENDIILESMYIKYFHKNYVIMIFDKKNYFDRCLLKIEMFIPNKNSVLFFLFVYYLSRIRN